MALTFLSNHLRTSRNAEPKAIIRILQLILLTKQGSNEAQNLLPAVISIVSKPLEHALRSHQRQDPKNLDIEPLLKAIRDNTQFPPRTTAADHKEFEQWTNNPAGGLSASIRGNIQGMIQWSLHPGVNIMPTSYTHRQMIAGLKILGPKRLLHLILDEVKQNSDAGSNGVVYDIAIALICAPDVTNLAPSLPPSLLGDPSQQAMPVQMRVSLRQALRWEAEDCKKIQKSDPVMAEHVVRLYRRVEAQLVMPPPPELIQNDLGLGLDGNAAASIGDALAVAQGDPMDAMDAMVTDDGAMSLDLGPGPADMGLDMGSADGGLGLDDDIFGSLGSIGGATDLLDGWDGI
jgi:mediator of RNA polymerase II transcription subunit 5